MSIEDAEAARLFTECVRFVQAHGGTANQANEIYEIMRPKPPPLTLEEYRLKYGCYPQQPPAPIEFHGDQNLSKEG